jgi:hypothetical protein
MLCTPGERTVLASRNSQGNSSQELDWLKDESFGNLSPSSIVPMEWDPLWATILIDHILGLCCRAQPEAPTLFFFFFLSLFLVLGSEFMLARQVLYHLSHARPALFVLFLPRPAWTVTLFVPPAYLGWEVHATTPSLLLEMESW